MSIERLPITVSNLIMVYYLIKSFGKGFEGGGNIKYIEKSKFLSFLKK